MREEGCPEISDLWSRSWNLKVRWVSCWINLKPPWMRPFLIPDVRIKWCSIPYSSGDYLEAVPSSLRKRMNPDCECCLGSLAVTLFTSMNLIKEIVSDEVSTKTWCHIYKTFLKILEDGEGHWQDQPKILSKLQNEKQKNGDNQIYFRCSTLAVSHSDRRRAQMRGVDLVETYIEESIENANRNFPCK